MEKRYTVEKIIDTNKNVVIDTLDNSVIYEAGNLYDSSYKIAEDLNKDDSEYLRVKRLNFLADALRPWHVR